MASRRDFLKHGGVAVGAAALGGTLIDPGAASGTILRGALETPSGASTKSSAHAMDAPTKDMLLEALNAAKLASASYADARIGRYQQNFVFTREKQIINVVDTDSIGIGVRALVDGAWGFGASRTLTKDGVAAAAREAVAIAKANRIARDRPVELAPSPTHPT